MNGDSFLVKGANNWNFMKKINQTVWKSSQPVRLCNPLAWNVDSQLEERWHYIIGGCV